MKLIRVLTVALALLLMPIGASVAYADEPPPPPEVDVTLDLTGVLNRTSGVATITGVATCSGAVDFTDLVVEVNQYTNAGRGGFGQGFGTFVCDGTTQPWSVQVAAESGKFVVGIADVKGYAAACGPGDCGFDWDASPVRLKAA